MKYSVCTDALFKNIPTEEALKFLPECGYDTFEFWHLAGKDIEKIKIAKEKYNLTLSTFCTSHNNLVSPCEREFFLEGLKNSIEIAKYLNCSTLICTVGNEIENISRSEMQTSIIDGLISAKEILKKSSVTIVLEPLNIRVNHKGYYLYSSDEAVEIIKKVDSENVKILFDYYHQSISEGDLIRRTQTYFDYIGHIHCAANPNRCELTNICNEINYKAIFKVLKDFNYKGYIGLEYFINSDPCESLKELKNAIFL